jgi:hypothetical protein
MVISIRNFFFRRIVAVCGKLPQTVQSRQVYMVVSGLYVLRQPAQSLYRACAFYGNPRRACAEPVPRAEPMLRFARFVHFARFTHFATKKHLNKYFLNL